MARRKPRHWNRLNESESTALRTDRYACFIQNLENGCPPEPYSAGHLPGGHSSGVVLNDVGAQRLGDPSADRRCGLNRRLTSDDVGGTFDHGV